MGTPARAANALRDRPASARTRATKEAADVTGVAYLRPLGRPVCRCRVQRCPFGAIGVLGAVLRGLCDESCTYTIVHMASTSVYDRVPSPAAGLLQLARLEAGLSQQDLAERAGVDRTMISAYEHDRRQPTLPTLLKLLKAAGFELRMHLEPYDTHDDVLAAREQARSSAERAAWENRQHKRLAAIDERQRAAKEKASKPRGER